MAKAFTRKLKHCFPGEKQHRNLLLGFAQSAKPTTLIRDKELVCKAHFVSSLKKRKKINMCNDYVRSWINALFQAQNILRVSYLPPPRKGFLFGLDFETADEVEAPDSTSCC